MKVCYNKQMNEEKAEENEMKRKEDGNEDPCHFSGEVTLIAVEKVELIFLYSRLFTPSIHYNLIRFYYFNKKLK